MKKICSLLFIILLTSSCKQTSKNDNDTTTAIAQKEDYNTYLMNLKPFQSDLSEQAIDSLKNVVAANPGYIIDAAKLASSYDSRYNATGNIDALLSFVRFRESVARNTAVKPENSYRLLAQAYIKRHEFKKADSVMQSFTQDYISDASKFIQFDIDMELGNYKHAKILLDSLRNTTNFNYLIRAAKYNDYDGKLDNTINLLETATAIAVKSGNESNMLWAFSNLGDYYGHHGDIEKSYKHYLKALALDPSNHYCLKGIAWIAYSYDNNTQEAIRILMELKKTHKIPDYDLMLAEMYESLGNLELASTHKTAFLNEVADSRYGNMYNLYKIEQWLSGTSQQKEAALKLAQVEINNRATPETYGFLAHALLVNNHKVEALEIIEKHVKNKTYEPVATLQMALVYKAHGLVALLKPLKEDLLGTRYEMGPVAYLQINDL